MFSNSTFRGSSLSHVKFVLVLTIQSMYTTFLLYVSLFYYIIYKRIVGFKGNTKVYLDLVLIFKFGR